MWGRARAAAARTLAGDVEIFESLGYRRDGEAGPLAVRLVPGGGGRPVVVRLRQQGRIFGGTYALEVATAEPVLPATGGVSGRARGLVRLAGVGFAARRGDEAGARLARRLTADERLQRALARVHFEGILVEPEGRAVVRHMGGSVVWVLFPPVLRPVAFTAGQARATLAALDAFARTR